MPRNRWTEHRTIPLADFHAVKEQISARIQPRPERPATLAEASVLRAALAALFPTLEYPSEEND